MSDLLDNIAEQLQHYSHGKVIAVVCDFLAELDEDQQKRFLNMIARGPHPLVAGSMGLGDDEDLLGEIHSLRGAIANGEYVDFVDYSSEYGAHTGFGDDSWIDEMDDLFDAATSFFRPFLPLNCLSSWLQLGKLFSSQSLAGAESLRH